LGEHSLNIGAKPIRLQMDPDPRLAAGAGGAARYLAEAAGLPPEKAAELQAAVVNACKQAFDFLSPENSRLYVTFKSLAGRIEIEISHEGEVLPALGLDAIAGFGANSGSAMSGVDRVQFEKQGDAVVTRLTKYIPQATPAN
jgi:hypothetical protein